MISAWTRIGAISVLLLPLCSRCTDTFNEQKNIYTLFACVKGKHKARFSRDRSYKDSLKDSVPVLELAVSSLRRKCVAFKFFVVSRILGTDSECISVPRIRDCRYVFFMRANYTEIRLYNSWRNPDRDYAAMHRQLSCDLNRRRFSQLLCVAHWSFHYLHMLVSEFTRLVLMSFIAAQSRGASVDFRTRFRAVTLTSIFIYFQLTV